MFSSSSRRVLLRLLVLSPIASHPSIATRIFNDPTGDERADVVTGTGTIRIPPAAAAATAATGDDTSAGSGPTFAVVLDAADDDKHWDEKMSHCSFCRHFLLSPCKEQFKQWSRCVDQSRALGEDFTTACSEQTRSLMQCTDTHTDYFSTASQDDEVEGNAVEEEVEGNGTVLDGSDDGPISAKHIDDVEDLGVGNPPVEHPSEDTSSHNDMIGRYLSSPCKEQFQQWAQCIDACNKDRSDFHTSCRQLSEALIDCTNVHQDFFQRLDDEHSDD